MYTFDLMKAELLIGIANAVPPHKEKANGANYSRLADLICTSLEEAQKLILNAKPESITPK